MSGVLYRWCGSKARILPELMAHLDGGAKYRRWIEPFLGGGSVALEAMRRRLAREWRVLRRDRHTSWPVLCAELGSFLPPEIKQRRTLDSARQDMRKDDMDEHQRLADACNRLLDAICPDFSGDIPTAIHNLADILISDKTGNVAAFLSIVDEEETGPLEDVLARTPPYSMRK